MSATVRRPAARTTPRRKQLKVGMLPLADAAPLLVARDLGFFNAQGLDVELTLETSWAGIRDKLAAGMINAAQLLAPMPLAANLGADHLGVTMQTALTLSRNGNSITVSQSLFDAMDRPAPAPIDAGWALRRVIEQDRAAGRGRRVFAHTFPFSTHHYLLRDWLAASAIDPDRDVSLVVVPPSLMPDQLRAGRIDGYCVGAPWGMAAELAGLGQRLFGTQLLRPNCAEKVLGVTRDWATLNPHLHLSLVAALIEAGRWLDQAENRLQAAQMLIDARLMAVPAEALRIALTDDGSDPRGPAFVFGARDAANPHHDDARWFLAQMRRWSQLPETAVVAEIPQGSYDLRLHAQAAAIATATPRQLAH